MKDIVIIANFCRDFSEKDNGRFMYLCKELSKEQHVEIITSDFWHSAKKHRDPLNINWPFKITFLHEPGYRKNISIQRFFSHYSWGRKVEKYLQSRKKPDVIYCAIPSLTAPAKAAQYCKKNNIKFVIDIQDLWPEAFTMVLNIPIISSLLFAPFKYLANQIYTQADEICAVSDTYVDRALSVNEKVRLGHTVYLGTKLETYDNGALSDSIICKANKEIWLGYCGSLSASYDIPCVIDALVLLKKKGFNPPKFIVMGDGAKKDEFYQYAVKNQIDAIFTGRLDYDQMCAVLSQCNMVINPIVKDSAASIINKHGDYASSGLPVINTQDSMEYRNLIDYYKMGVNCENGNAVDVAEKIEYLIKNPSESRQMGINARRCAEERFDREHSYKELINCITQ